MSKYGEEKSENKNLNGDDNNEKEIGENVWMKRKDAKVTKTEEDIVTCET